MWRSVEGGGSAPRARAKHSAALAGGALYVLGGRGAGGALPLRDFWRYSLASGEWEKLQCLGDPPPALQEHSMCAHGSRLYVFGGEAGALSNETPLWIYDTQTGIWRKLPGQSSYPQRRRNGRETRGTSGTRGATVVGGAAGPRGRRGHSAHALDDCLLVYGGYRDLRGSTNELWAFHYESESWQQVRTAREGPARHRHVAALHAARLYVHAGRADLHACADLWHYDTVSREWTAVRAARGPSARSGHAGLRAGGHLYIFGGDGPHGPHRDLWRFHFASETWERIEQTLQWPSARVDACALLVAGGALPPHHDSDSLEEGGAEVGAGDTLGGVRWRRGVRGVRGGGGAYCALEPRRDSTDSLLRHEAALAKSKSAYAIEGGRSGSMSRAQVSVPDFAAVRPARDPPVPYTPLDTALHNDLHTDLHTGIVRYKHHPNEDSSTSDYASAERVNRLSGFSNPHYLGPDIRGLAALTPDSGVGAQDIELQDMRPHSPRLHFLLIGGKESSHPAHLQSPLSMWSYRLL